MSHDLTHYRHTGTALKRFVIDSVFVVCLHDFMLRRRTVRSRSPAFLLFRFVLCVSCSGCGRDGAIVDDVDLIDHNEALYIACNEGVFYLANQQGTRRD